MPPESTPEGTDLDGPPDDFGAALLAEFKKREFAADQSRAAAFDGGEPPGGWPEVDTPATTATPPASGGAEGVGESTSEATTDEGSPASTTTTTDTTTDTAATATTDPAADPAIDPAAGEPADTADTTTEPVEPAGGWTWRYNDGAAERETTFTDEQLQRAVALSAWADALPEETRMAMGALETGQAVAIPRADYDQFVAWKQQQTQATRDADLANLDVDPEVAKLIGGLRDEVQQLRGSTPAQPSREDPTVRNTYANLDAASQRMEAAMENYTRSRGLSEAEVQQLMDTALHAEVIPKLMEAGSQYNQVTGALLRPADVGQVVEEALDWALVRNPALKTKVLSGQPTPAQPPAGTPANGAQPSAAANDAVAQKKARASSLATAPSGAPAPTPQTTRAMTETERVAAMAKDIEAAIAAG